MRLTPDSGLHIHQPTYLAGASFESLHAPRDFHDWGFGGQEKKGNILEDIEKLRLGELGSDGVAEIPQKLSIFII